MEAGMADSALWAMTHQQRRDVADMLDGLTDEQWAADSLCSGWPVRDMAAHMIAVARMTPGRFVRGLAEAGFRFNVLANRQIALRAGWTPKELVAELRETAGLTSGPPGPPQTPLSEAVVHGMDISRPLGIKQEIPPQTLTTALDFYRNTQLLIGAKKRIAGLRLTATDLKWRHGDGPEVSGPAASLLMAMAGRRAALADLTGDGVQVLSARR
jgi:uncharacterized protein (TIGR03083 family)